MPELPTEIIGRRTPLTPGNKAYLIAASKHLEHQALLCGNETMIVSCFQHERFFTGETRRRYAELAKTVGVVVALGEDMAAEPAPGVRGGTLDPSDALLGEWSVAVLGPLYSVALVARDLGDAGPQDDRRFDFAMTFDPTEVADIVVALLARVNSPQPAGLALAA